MYVLETDSSEAVESTYVIKFTETYVLETDPYRGCIEHIRKVYVLETDTFEVRIQHVKVISIQEEVSCLPCILISVNSKTGSIREVY